MILIAKKAIVSQEILQDWNSTEQTIAVINDAATKLAKEMILTIFVNTAFLDDKAEIIKTNVTNSIIASGLGPVDECSTLPAT